MRRRDFVTLLSSAAVAYPLAARAQRSEQLRRIGVIYGLAETDLEARAWEASFRKRLAELGWTDGRNVRIEDRWTGGSMDPTKQFANELVRLNPDVPCRRNHSSYRSITARARTIPIIFTSVSDPVGGGFVASLPNPGGNITGCRQAPLPRRRNAAAAGGAETAQPQPPPL
jgi:putative tryptophan/tyrosine transport system substrate-binding protein